MESGITETWSNSPPVSEVGLSPVTSQARKLKQTRRGAAAGFDVSTWVGQLTVGLAAQQGPIIPTPPRRFPA